MVHRHHSWVGLLVVSFIWKLAWCKKYSGKIQVREFWALFLKHMMSSAIGTNLLPFGENPGLSLMSGHCSRHVLPVHGAHNYCRNCKKKQTPSFPYSCSSSFSFFFPPLVIISRLKVKSMCMRLSASWKSNHLNKEAQKDYLVLRQF